MAERRFPPTPKSERLLREILAPSVDHRDGVPWFEATPHRWWQRHRAQTTGFVSGRYVARCSCGAYGPAPWTLLDKRRKR